MYRILFVLIICSMPLCAEDSLEQLFSSAPEQVVSLAQDEFLIGGVINPLSGQPSLRQTDLVAKGAQNIPLTRIP